MKVILMTSEPCIASNVAVEAFMRNTLRKKYNIEVVGIISVSMWSKGLRWVERFIRKSGLIFACKSVLASFWQNLSIRFAKYCIPDKNRKYFEIDEIAEKYNVPLLHTKDINGKDTQRWMKSKRPDIMVSCLLLQLVKKDTLKIPKDGCINFHPALFEKHRGTFSSFWALFRNQDRSGTTVHYMTEKLDDGKIILQRQFFIEPSDSIHCVNLKSAKLGGNLLVKALVKIKRKKAKTTFAGTLSRIFAEPSRDESKKFLKSGRKIIHWKDFFEV